MNKEISFLIRIIKEAQAITRQNFEVHQKDDKGDLVTSLDLEVEKFLISQINQNYPDYAIVSEEFNSDGTVHDNCFIIDPIDGTINFANGLPLWGIQIACRKAGRTIASVIDLPVLQEFYHADETGAYLNGQKIRIEEVPVINAVYSIMGRNAIPALGNMIAHSRNYRNFGAACAAFAFMARGRIHGVSFTVDNPWDYEPGLFLCKMAGAEIKNVKGFHAAAMTRDLLDILEAETALLPGSGGVYSSICRGVAL